MSLLKTLSETKLIELYRKMVTARAFEYKIKELYAKGKVVGGFHLGIGQEAVGVGVCGNHELREDDYIIHHHRSDVHLIARGVDIKRLMAEVFGKKTGLCKGKAGHMHITDLSRNMLDISGIIGGTLPLAVGLGLSFRLRGTDQIVIVLFGDGASNQGTFHEAINLAAIWRLPVIFACENNQYAESIHYSRVMLVKHIADRAPAYGIPGVVVDGMDVMAVYEATSKAIKRVRERKGPMLLEFVTYRYVGHEEAEPWTTYRTKEEVEEWKKRDPIETFKASLIERGMLTEEEAKKIDQKTERSIEEAVEFAEESPWPEPEEAFKDVFVSPYY